MLKIKDNVDLKELEKFGFKYDKSYDFWDKYIPYMNHDNEYIHCVINDYKYIYVYADRSVFELDSLFDLIQAGLVEKVDD